MIASTKAPSIHAYGDLVLLFEHMPDSILPISIPKTHLLVYLARLVALSEGRPVSSWGYQFAMTKDGFPFSGELEQARQHFVQNSVLAEHDGLLEAGGDQFGLELKFFRTLRSVSKRQNYFRTAALCLLYLPTGALRAALDGSPGIAAALVTRAAMPLLREMDVDRIYQEFELIVQEMGTQGSNSLHNAMAWLTAYAYQEA